MNLGLYPHPGCRATALDWQHRDWFPRTSVNLIKIYQKIAQAFDQKYYFFSEWVVNYITQKVLSENGLRTIFLLRCLSVLMEADGCLGIRFSLWFFFLFALPATLPSVSLTFSSSSSCIWWCSTREVHSSNENNNSSKIFKVPADLIPGETCFLACSHLPPFVSSRDHFFVLVEREKEL